MGRSVASVSRKTLERIGRATLDGWSFQYFKRTDRPTSRHSVWVQEPGQEGWACHKVSGEHGDDWIDALLDHVGVPR